MEKREATVIAASLLCAMGAGQDEGAPEGVLYAGLMGRMNLDEFQTMLRVFVSAGWTVHKGHHHVALTETGRRMVAEIERATGAMVRS